MTREEAIKVVRNIYQTDAEKEALEALIPELKESEDERIRKMLIEKVEKWHEKALENNMVEDIKDSADIITYLEKQKDASKAIEAVDRIDKYIDENVANAHDMKDSNPDKKYYRGWDDALGAMAGILQDVYSEKENKFAPRVLPCSAAWFEDSDGKQKDFQAKVEQRMEYLWDKLPDAHRVEEGNCTPEEWKALGAYMELEMNFDEGSEEKQKELKPEPVFKVGDKIKLKSEPNYPYREIIDIKNGAYYFDEEVYLPFDNQDNWEKEQKSEDVTGIIYNAISEVCHTGDPKSFSEMNQTVFKVTQRVAEICQKSAEWSDDIIRKAVKEVGLTQHQINWFKSNVFPPKPEWSEKEKKMLAVISYKISQHQGNDERSLFTPDEAEFICGMEDKFKSLRPQSKKELSIEKAIQWLDDTFYFLDNSSGRGRDCEITTHDFDSLEEMYDSFRKAVTVDSEPHWKPSEEQLEALKKALHINPANGKLHELKENEVCILQSLLRELEKL